MVLDFASQESLEIFSNQELLSNEKENEIGTSVGKKKESCNSLIELIDNTSTPFGRRLLRKWLSAPLTDVNLIKARQEAINDLLYNFDIVKAFRSQMTKV
jgi:DNA mismatch repair ATPase MutS